MPGRDSGEEERGMDLVDGSPRRPPSLWWVSPAFRRGLEEGERKPLEDDADVEVDNPGAGQVDVDALDGEPEEELLSGDPGDGGDPAVA